MRCVIFKLERRKAKIRINNNAMKFGGAMSIKFKNGEIIIQSNSEGIPEIKVKIGREICKIKCHESENIEDIKNIFERLLSTQNNENIYRLIDQLVNQFINDNKKAVELYEKNKINFEDMIRLKRSISNNLNQILNEISKFYI